jgi:hypothetical protein
MLRTIETISSYQLEATDGPIGHVDDFYFDDEHWALRYLVVDTGKWRDEKCWCRRWPWPRSIGGDAQSW